MMKIKGIHHISAITQNVQENYNFYSKVLGLKLIKNTIRFGDETSRKLYYANNVSEPMPILSFMERKNALETVTGNNEITTTSLLVANDESLAFWKERFESLSVEYGEFITMGERKALPFKDTEGRKLLLLSTNDLYQSKDNDFLTEQSIPAEHQIISSGPTVITVKNEQESTIVLKEVLSFKEIESYPSFIEEGTNIKVLSSDKPQLHNEIHLQLSDNFTQGKTGFSSIHHIAFRVKGIEELREWRDLFERIRMPNSGILNHHYYKSIYFRDGNGILYELATDEPGFTIDEDIEELGTTLSLPRSLKKQRRKIEESLTPLALS